MGKYSNMERKDRDFYSTPIGPVKYLVKFLTDNLDKFETDTKFIEPCAGDARLINNVMTLAEHHGYDQDFKCVYASDIHPINYDENEIPIIESNIFEVDWEHIAYKFDAGAFITNPPWINTKESGFQLNSIIKFLAQVRPTWLLLNANYAWNQKSAECMSFCTDIVPVGRVKWIDESKSCGKEDCAWFRFDAVYHNGTTLHPRMKL